MILSSAQHRDILDLMVEAGQEALWMRSHDLLNPCMKNHNAWSVVTDADIVVHHLLSEALNAMFPAIGVISEEDAQSRPNGRYLTRWVIDPIDGSKDFNDGGSKFGILAALVVRGKPIHGFAYYPSFEYGKIYFTDETASKAYSARVAFNILTCAPEYKNVAQLSTAPTNRPPHVAQDFTDIKDYFKHHFVEASHRSPSALIAMLEGRADFAAGPSTMADWDLAAADALARCSGAAIVNVYGKKPLKYGQRRPPDRAYLQPRYIAGNTEMLKRLGLMR